MNSKPLQYESLKIVLEYLDANRRYEISRHCPTIRSTEKIVPLYINQLSFNSVFTGPRVVSINSTDYRIGTIRVYPQGAPIPKPYLEDNKRGGLSADLDQFGFQNVSSDHHFTPGDVVIEDLERRASEPYSKFRIKMVEEGIELWEIVLAKKRIGEAIPDTIRGLGSTEFARKESIEELRDLIETKNAFLLPYKNMRENTPAEFTTAVQLSVISKNELILAQDFPEKKVYQVEKRLNEFLFGGRKSISVKTFETDDSYPVLRLPSGISMKIQNLNVPYCGFRLCRGLAPIIHASCLPLNQVKFHKLDGISSPNDLVRGVKKLVIAYDENIWKFMEHVTNQVVDVCLAKFSPHEYVRLAEDWVETQRPIGTCYSFGVKKRKVTEKTMKMIKRQLNGEKVKRKCLIVPIDETSQLKVYYKKNKSHTKEETKWKFFFEVVGV